MNNALQIYDGGGFELMQRAAQAMVQSGYFKDSRDVAQAIVKVMAGAELGIAPFAAMSGIHVVQGKPVLSSNLIATLVKNDPRYNYRVKLANDAECRIAWYENGEACGESSFSMQEADNAGLTGKQVWKQYPSDMLFARALTRGARRFAPGIFGGAPVYTPEEVGLDTNDEGGLVIDGDFDTKPPARKVIDIPETVHPDGVRRTALDEHEQHVILPDFRSAEEVKVALIAASVDGSAQPAGEKQLKYARASLSKLVGGNNHDAGIIIKAVLGLDSSNELTGGQASALIDWAGATRDNNYTVSPASVGEAARIVEAYNVAQGQKSLLDKEANPGAYAE